MATVTGFTAARMKEIEDATVINGGVVDDDLVLVRRDGGTINAGNVRGPAGFQGPPGDLSDAPVDGKLWVRKDGSWHALATTATTNDGVTYGLRNGAWQAINLPTDAPNDNQKYLIKNDTYVRADQPWKLSLTQATVTLPSGFSVGTVILPPSGDGLWNWDFSGSGYNVNYSFSYVVTGLVSASPVTRFTLPTALRPVQLNTSPVFAWSGFPGISGVVLQKITTAGLVTVPNGAQPLGLRWVSGTGSVTDLSTYSFTITGSGSFTRTAETLPPGATYV